MKILLRHFNNGDRGFISAKLFAGTTHDDAVAMIKEWDTLQYKGVYFEMFAVTADNALAGLVSLYEKEKDSVYIGAIITPEFRRKGVAYLAITEVLRRAKQSGYKKAAARVLKDNTPGLKLSEKLGLCITGEDITPDKKEVYNLEKIL